MSFTVNLSGGGLLINRFNSSNMLKSTQEKLQRQQERDNKVAFFEAQKENLKNRKADTLEEISEKLEMFHNYENEIAAANQELLMEERRKELEKELEAAVQKARTGGLTAKEIRESFEIIMEDEVC
jgi:2-keto-4-pentenoate hydratase/2-oxohepta-3-ene-1,7-dioic acid hydratase in catechol pathway